MSSEEVRILKRRAEAFLKYAEKALSDGEFGFLFAMIRVKEKASVG